MVAPFFAPPCRHTHRQTVMIIIPPNSLAAVTCNAWSYRPVQQKNIAECGSKTGIGGNLQNGCIPSRHCPMFPSLPSRATPLNSAMDRGNAVNFPVGLIVAWPPNALWCIHFKDEIVSIWCHKKSAELQKFYSVKIRPILRPNIIIWWNSLSGVLPLRGNSLGQILSGGSGHHAWHP